MLSTRKYNIQFPPGYKLCTHLFHSALRKLNDKVIKFKLLRRYIHYLKNYVKFDRYDYSQLDYEFYFGKEGEATGDNRWKNLIDNLKFNPHLNKLQEILTTYINYSNKYNVELESEGRCWSNISQNKYLSKEFIIKNINNNWNWRVLIQNGIIDLNFIEKYVPTFWEKNLSHMNSLYCTKFIVTMDFIEKYIDKPWNWRELSWNSNITSEFIEKHIDKPWSNIHVNVKNGIDLNFIEKHIDKPWWDFKKLSRFVERKFPTREDTLRLLNIKVTSYCYYIPSTGGHFTIPKEFVFNNFDKDWDLDWLFSDGLDSPLPNLLPDITEDMLEKYPVKLSEWA